MVAINTGNSSYHTTNQAVTGNAGASAPGLIGVGKEPTQNRNNQTAQQAAQHTSGHRYIKPAGDDSPAGLLHAWVNF